MKTGRPGSTRLLEWFDQSKRELPWRRSTDTYPVWVSEIMLQQTQVERVIPYFERFLERFPAVEDLAGASIDDVLALWSGLGYYRRARSLHAAARQIVAQGCFPDGYGSWKDLPGVGEYTAAAISSICFGVKVPAIDGNVERVVSRWRAIGGDLKKSTGRKELIEETARLLDERRPGDSNQALMELGATICRPRHPDCHACPLREDCCACLRGEIESFPRTRERRETIKKRHLGVVVEKRGSILLVRRPETSDVLSGLWELPWIPWVEALEAPGELASRYGGRWILESRCGWVRHSITHRSIRMEVWRGLLSVFDEIAEGGEAGWFAPDEIMELAHSSLMHKALDCARVSVLDDG